jgi:hypothetical protein
MILAMERIPFNKGNMVDLRLFNYIKRELPEALARMNITLKSNDLLDTLAEHFAEHIKSYGVCLESLEKLELNTNLTPEDHREFEDYLDQIIRLEIMTKGKKVNDHLFKYIMGLAWSKISGLVGNENEVWEREQQTANAGVGVRG